MEEVLIPIVVVPVIFFSFVMVVKTVSDNNVRRRLIDKGELDENVKYLFQQRYAEFIPNALKWGMVLIGVGSAFLIGLLVPYSYKDEVTASSMFILAGLGLVLYYFIARRQADSEKEE